MTKAPAAPTTAVPELRRTDPDVTALRRCIATIERDGWWNGSSRSRRPGAHCVATAIRYNEYLPRRCRLMWRLRKELGRNVRAWNDSHTGIYLNESRTVIRSLDFIAAKWERE